MRTISLVPSATETLLAWGCDPVAVTRFCEQGDRFPTVGGTKDPDLAAIVALRPDLVVVCDQENRLPDYEAMVAAGLTVHVVSIVSISDVGPQMEALATALGLDAGLGAACAPKMSATTVTGVPSRVFVPIWRKPWMTINAETYGGTVLANLGLENVFGAHTDRYPTVTDDEIVGAQSNLVLAPSEPYPFTERQRTELERFGTVRYVDGKDLFWWGVRTPDAVARLRQQIDC